MSRLPGVTQQAMELFDSCYRTTILIRDFPKIYRFIEELWSQAESLGKPGMPVIPHLSSSEDERLAAVTALEEWAIALAHGLVCDLPAILEAITRFHCELEKCEMIEADGTLWQQGPLDVYNTALQASNLVDRAEMALQRQLPTDTNGEKGGQIAFIESLQEILSGILLIRDADDEPAGFVCSPDVAAKLEQALAAFPSRNPNNRPLPAPTRLDNGEPIQDRKPHSGSSTQRASKKRR